MDLLAAPLTNVQQMSNVGLQLMVILVMDYSTEYSDN